MEHGSFLGHIEVVGMYADGKRKLLNPKCLFLSIVATSCDV